MAWTEVLTASISAFDTISDDMHGKDSVNAMMPIQALMYHIIK